MQGIENLCRSPRTTRASTKSSGDLALTSSERNPNNARSDRERDPARRRRTSGRANRRSEGEKIARIQVEQIENRLRNHTRTHERTNSEEHRRQFSHLSFPSQPLHERRARGSEHPAGRSTPPADGEEGEDLGRSSAAPEAASISGSGLWKERRGEGGGGSEARLRKRGRKEMAADFFCWLANVSSTTTFSLLVRPTLPACNSLSLLPARDEIGVRKKLLLAEGKKKD